MRYIQQRDRVSCGPVSITNALKWAGLDATGRDSLPFLKFACRTVDLENPTDFESQGTDDWDFDRVLRYVGKGTFKVRRKKFPSLRDIEKHIETGGAVAFSYHWEDGAEGEDHYSFISGMERGFFCCVNDHSSPNSATVNLRSVDTLRKWLKRHNDCPVAWFLTMEK